MGGRVVEGTGLEKRQTRKRLEGSNTSPSANTASSLVRRLPEMWWKLKPNKAFQTPSQCPLLGAKWTSLIPLSNVRL